jgi:hypothetical protein
MTCPKSQVAAILGRANEQMIIRYANGHAAEAILLSRTQSLVRLQLHGSDDVAELTQINGTWVTENCEPVQVEFGWTPGAPPVVTLNECICSHELAGRLLHMLFSGESDPETAAALDRATASGVPAYHNVI